MVGTLVKTLTTNTITYFILFAFPTFSETKGNFTTVTHICYIFKTYFVFTKQEKVNVRW